MIGSQPILLWVALVTIAAVIAYISTIIGVGRARGKYGVKAPTMIGHPDFERAIRVQANSLELLVPFVIVLWLCALTGYPLFAAIVGAIFVIGRVIYAIGYYRAAEKRNFGFLISAIAIILLLIGALVGIIRLMLIG